MPLWKFSGSPESRRDYYRPAVSAFFILNYKIWGLNPAGFHLTNILLHMITVIILYRIGLLLFEKEKDREPISLMAASIFAVHPVHNETVGRAASGEVIFGFLVVISLYFYLKERRYLSLFAFFLALLAKESAVMMPFALTVLSTDRKGLKKGLIEIIPYMSLVCLYLILRATFVDIILGYSGAPTLFAKVLTMAAAFFDYIRLLVIPYHLSPFYPAKWYTSILEPKVMLAISVLMMIAFLAFKIRKEKVMLFSLSFFFLLLAPVVWRVNTFPVGKEDLMYIAERFLYMPAVGFAFFVSSYAVKFLKDRAGRYLTGGWVVVTVVLIVITIFSNMTWKDNLTLYRKIISESPDVAFAHINLGVAYYKKGQPDAAIDVYKEVIRLRPGSIDAHHKLGAAYYEQGRLDEALQEYLITIRLSPGFAKAHHGIGLIYAVKGRLDEAVKEFLSALRLDPDYPEVFFALGRVYAAQGRLDEALKEYKNALRLKPNYPKVFYNLGKVYAAQGRLNEAIPEYQNTLRLNPDYTEAHIDLGNAYLGLGQTDNAIMHYQSALRLNPNLAVTHNNLGLAYRQKGLINEAMQEFQAALKIQPDFMKARSNFESLQR